MHIIIFGTGGVGGNYGGYLARSGADVTFIARGAHLRAIEENGLQIESSQGNFSIKPAQVTDDLRKAGKADVILLCTKAWQLDEAIEQIKPMMGGDTFVVPLLNSVEAADVLASRLGAENVLGGLCYTTAYIIRPGVIYGDGSRIIFGELDHRSTPRAESLERIINAAEGIAAINSSNIHFDMWKKSAWISSASAVGAVTRVPIGVWRKIPESMQLFQTLVREAFAVAKARGVVLGEDIFADIMAFVAKLPDGFTTSMQRDVLAGKQSELRQQIGAVVRIGKMEHVPTPISEAIYGALLPADNSVGKSQRN